VSTDAGVNWEHDQSAAFALTERQTDSAIGLLASLTCRIKGTIKHAEKVKL
jgi:hypothetical protein